jgi:hypothetical protein
MKQVLKSLLAALVSVAVLFTTGVLLHRAVSRTPEDLVVSRVGGAILDDAPIVFEASGAPGRDVVLTLDEEAVADPVMQNGQVILMPGSLPPGMHAVSWEVRYLGRRPREAAFAVLAGPFTEPGATVPCAIRAAVGQEAVVAIATPLVEAIFEGVADVAVLPPAERVGLSPRLVDGGLDVSIEVDFDEGSQLRATVPLGVLLSPEGELAAHRRDDVEATVTGTLGTMAAIRGGGIGAALESLARRPRGGLQAALEAAREAGREEAAREITRQVDRWLPEMNRALADRMPSRLSMVLGDARVVLELSPCGEPGVPDGRALVMRYDARPRVVPLVGDAPDLPDREAAPGPLRRHDAPLGLLPPAPVPGMSMTFSEDLLNAALHEAWRVGALDRMLGDARRLEEINATLAAYSALQIRSLDLDLPPILEAGEAGLRGKVGELRLGLVSDGEPVSDMVAVAEAEISAAVDGARVSLALESAAVRASCSIAENGVHVRRPCLSDLVGEAEAMIGRRFAFDMTVPVQEFAEGVRLRLEAVRARPGELELVASLRPD